MTGDDVPDADLGRRTRVLALVPDLMDHSKVAAAAAGRVTFVRQAEELVAAVPASGAELIVLDLSRPGAVDAVASIAGLDPRPRMVGFASHIDRDLLASAREAGCDRVLARSAFFSDLPGHLA